MTISSQYAPVYLPIEVDLTYDFAIENIGDTSIQVYEVYDNGDKVLLPPSAYTIAQDARPPGNPIYQGGTVTVNQAHPNGVVAVSIERLTPITQDVDLNPYEPMPADLVEFALDKLTLQRQEELLDPLGAGGQFVRRAGDTMVGTLSMLDASITLGTSLSGTQTRFEPGGFSSIAGELELRDRGTGPGGWTMWTTSTGATQGTIAQVMRPLTRDILGNDVWEEGELYIDIPENAGIDPDFFRFRYSADGFLLLPRINDISSAAIPDDAAVTKQWVIANAGGGGDPTNIFPNDIYVDESVFVRQEPTGGEEENRWIFSSFNGTAGLNDGWIWTNITGVDGQLRVRTAEWVDPDTVLNTFLFKANGGFQVPGDVIIASNTGIGNENPSDTRNKGSLEIRNREPILTGSAGAGYAWYSMWATSLTDNQQPLPLPGWFENDEGLLYLSVGRWAGNQAGTDFEYFRGGIRLAACPDYFDAVTPPNFDRWAFYDFTRTGVMHVPGRLVIDPGTIANENNNAGLFLYNLEAAETRGWSMWASEGIGGANTNLYLTSANVKVGNSSEITPYSGSFTLQLYGGTETLASLQEWQYFGTGGAQFPGKLSLMAAQTAEDTGLFMQDRLATNQWFGLYNEVVGGLARMVIAPRTNTTGSLSNDGEVYLQARSSSGANFANFLFRAGSNNARLEMTTQGNQWGQLVLNTTNNGTIKLQGNNIAELETVIGSFKVQAKSANEVLLGAEGGINWRFRENDIFGQIDMNYNTYIQVGGLQGNGTRLTLAAGNRAMSIVDDGVNPSVFNFNGRCESTSTQSGAPLTTLTTKDYVDGATAVTRNLLGQIAQILGASPAQLAQIQALLEA